MIKRRSFLQGIAAAIFGGGAALKAKKDVDLEHLEGEPVAILTKEKYEAALNYGKDEYSVGTRKEMPDGRIFRYCQNTYKPSTLLQRGKLCGVVHDKDWLQTYGECKVNMSGKRPSLQIVSVELE